MLTNQGGDVAGVSRMEDPKEMKMEKQGRKG